MNRRVIALVAIGLAAAGPADGQQTIETSMLRSGITLIASPPDGNVLVVRGRTATLVVDALAPGIAARADSAIRAAADGAPDWVINTHYHADHIGANDLLAAAGAVTVGHANLPALAARDTTITVLQWDLDPADPADLPHTLVNDSMRIDLGDESAHVLHLPRAHTGGDLIVRFTRANIMHTGDLVEIGAYPFIDWWAGGSYDGLLEAVDRVIALADEHTAVIPGHGPVLTRADVVAYRRMLGEVGDAVRAGIAAGQDADAIVESRPTAAWDERHGGERGGNRFVRLLHLEFTQSSSQVAVLAGTVRLNDGSAAPGALVRVAPEGATWTHTVIADAQGRFRLESLPPGRATLAAGFGGPWGPERAVELGAGEARVELEAGARSAGRADLPASSLLAMLPDDEERRRFIRDCTGCHVFDARQAYPGGTARSHASWTEGVTRMLGFAGPRSAFPVIAEGREAEATADYLSGLVTDAARPAAPPAASDAAAGAVITEYMLPVAQDLPHDVAVLPDGRVTITGMFTHQMYLLDGETGLLTTEAIPVGNANPRAVEIADDGAWWVVLGNPQTLARRDPSGEWRTWHVGTYPHSIALGADGRVWYNGHFSRNPEILGFVDPARDTLVALEVPAHPDAHVGAGPMPYELRTGPDGRIWGSELIGDRVFAYDPSTERFRTWSLPGTASGPRRLDVAPDGTVWIPEYSGGNLTRLDPQTGRFTQYRVPVDAASPYIARVDPRSGRVWLGTGAADAIFAFDPTTEAWTTYPLPSRATLVRHLAIDPRSDDLWIAYGASPGPPAKVARLRLPD